MQSIGGSPHLKAVVPRPAVGIGHAQVVGAIYLQGIIPGTQENADDFDIAGDHISIVAAGVINGRRAGVICRAGSFTVWRGGQAAQGHMHAQPGVGPHAQAGDIEGGQLAGIGGRVAGVNRIERVGSGLAVKFDDAVNIVERIGLITDFEGIIAGAAVNGGVDGGKQALDAHGIVAIAHLDEDLLDVHVVDPVSGGDTEPGDAAGGQDPVIRQAVGHVQAVFDPAVAVGPAVDVENALDAAQVAEHGGQREFVVVFVTDDEGRLRDPGGDEILVRTPAAVDGHIPRAAADENAVVTGASRQGVVGIANASDLHPRASCGRGQEFDLRTIPGVIHILHHRAAIQPDEHILARVSGINRRRDEYLVSAVAGELVSQQVIHVVGGAVAVNDGSANIAQNQDVVQVEAAVDGGVAARPQNGNRINPGITADGGIPVSVVNHQQVVAITAADGGIAIRIVNRDRVGAGAAVHGGGSSGVIDVNNVQAQAAVDICDSIGVVDGDQVSVFIAVDGGCPGCFMDDDNIGAVARVESGVPSGVVDGDGIYVALAPNGGGAVGVVDRNIVGAVAGCDRGRPAGHVYDHGIHSAFRVESGHAVRVVDGEQVFPIAAVNFEQVASLGHEGGRVSGGQAHREDVHPGAKLHPELCPGGDAVQVEDVVIIPGHNQRRNGVDRAAEVEGHAHAGVGRCAASAVIRLNGNRARGFDDVSIKHLDTPRNPQGHIPARAAHFKDAPIAGHFIQFDVAGDVDMLLADAIAVEQVDLAGKMGRGRAHAVDDDVAANFQEIERVAAHLGRACPQSEGIAAPGAGFPKRQVEVFTRHHRAKISRGIAIAEPGGQAEINTIVGEQGRIGVGPGLGARPRQEALRADGQRGNGADRSPIAFDQFQIEAPRRRADTRGGRFDHDDVGAHDGRRAGGIELTEGVIDHSFAQGVVN